MKKTRLKTTSPLISVIIPVYNAANFLADCLNSVFQQTYQPIEVIVIDDGSTDDSARIAQQLPSVQYFYQKNQGPSAARNKGIEKAQGIYITFLDADDTYPIGKISTQIAYLEKDVSRDFVRGLTQFVGKKNKPTTTTKINSQKYGVYLGAMLFRKSVFEQIGLFDDQFPIGADIDFWRRCEVYRLRHLDIPSVSLYYRQHNTNLTLNRQKIKAGYLRVFKNEIARKRKQQKQV